MFGHYLKNTYNFYVAKNVCFSNYGCRVEKNLQYIWALTCSCIKQKEHKGGVVADAVVVFTAFAVVLLCLVWL